jgi:hypothetical protein
MKFDIKLPFNSQDKMTPKEEIKFNNNIQSEYKHLISLLFNEDMYNNYTSFEELINSLKIGKLENNGKSRILKMFINEEIFDDINKNNPLVQNNKIEEGLFDNNIKIKQPFYINKLDIIKNSIFNYVKEYDKGTRR